MDHDIGDGKILPVGAATGPELHRSSGFTGSRVEGGLAAALNWLGASDDIGSFLPKTVFD